MDDEFQMNYWIGEVDERGGRQVDMGQRWKQWGGAPSIESRYSAIPATIIPLVPVVKVVVDSG